MNISFTELLEKYDDMVLYSIIMMPEYLENTLLDIGKSMNISVEQQIIQTVLESPDIKGFNKICFFRDNTEDKRRFIYADCHTMSDLHKICVRCLQSESQKVQESFMKWRNMTLDVYGDSQAIKTSPTDWIHTTKTIINPLLSSLQFNKLI